VLGRENRVRYCGELRWVVDPLVAADRSVAAGGAPAPAVSAPVTYTPERLDAARQMAAAIAVSTGIDATGLSLRARHAVHAYSAVRDGDRREYLHRVFGLEDQA